MWIWQLNQRINVNALRPCRRSFHCPGRRKLHCWVMLGMNLILKGKKVMVSQGFYRKDTNYPRKDPDYPKDDCFWSSAVGFYIWSKHTISMNLSIDLTAVYSWDSLVGLWQTMNKDQVKRTHKCRWIICKKKWKDAVIQWSTRRSGTIM